MIFGEEREDVEIAGHWAGVEDGGGRKLTRRWVERQEGTALEIGGAQDDELIYVG